ncbi:coiled-coil domain-containing protein 137-like [Rhopilema esculentum]|uniref:coiled-coil domain-containing protein 137-like n=1 Tax=Rhopilema esculentum TaxID=499914 RepID=UPI0031D7D399
MGRIGRQRRFKSIDPFATKSSTDGGKKYDLAPKSKDLVDSNDFVPRKARKIMKLTELSKDSHAITKRKHKSKKSPLAKLMKSGESRKQFLNRLDKQASEALNKAMTETKKLRDKRKEHLKKRDKKLKSRKSKQDIFPQKQESNQEEVKFGEVVSQPPTLSAVPRKAKSKSTKPALDLKLMDIIKGKNNDKAIDKLYKTKRKEMTDKMKKIHDEERQQAINEYRKIKQRKIMRT